MVVGSHIALVTYQVCASGNFPCASECIISNCGLSSLKPLGGIWEEPVTNCISLDLSSWVRLLTKTQNHDIVWWNLGSPLREILVCLFRSSSSTVSRPHMSNYSVNTREGNMTKCRLCLVCCEVHINILPWCIYKKSIGHFPWMCTLETTFHYMCAIHIQYPDYMWHDYHCEISGEKTVL